MPLKYLIKGNYGHFKAYHKSIIWHLKNMFSKEIHSNPTF